MNSLKSLSQRPQSTPLKSLKVGASCVTPALPCEFCFDCQRGLWGCGGGLYDKDATLILDQHSREQQDQEWKNRYLFLVRGTLLILINNVLVKCYCEVFFWENERRGVKGKTSVPQETHICGVLHRYPQACFHSSYFLSLTSPAVLVYSQIKTRSSAENNAYKAYLKVKAIVNELE